MKKLLIILSVMFLSLLALTGCSTDGDDNGDGGNTVDVGIVLPTRDEPRWIQDETRFKDLLAETDYSVEILFSQGSTATELSNVETLISRGIKVLIITDYVKRGTKLLNKDYKSLLSLQSLNNLIYSRVNNKRLIIFVNQ